MSGNGSHVAVLKGGWSSEREVSLVSGAECARALSQAGYKVSEIDVDRDIANVLHELSPDLAFNALHGPWGEDGCIQGLLEVMGLPYTHSGVLASALAMDKPKSKQVFAEAGLTVAKDLRFDRRTMGLGHPLAPPYVIKPSANGSSVGVFIVSEGHNRPPEQLYSDDWQLGDDLMAEEYIPGRELTATVLGDRALAVTEIIPAKGYYDYEAKYAAGGSSHTVPADIPKAVYDQALEMALEAHRAIGCRGVTRTDFRYDPGRPGGRDLVVLEINTQPGMTPTSLAPEQAAFVGMGFTELCQWIAEDASCNR